MAKDEFGEARRRFEAARRRHEQRMAAARAALGARREAEQARLAAMRLAMAARRERAEAAQAARMAAARARPDGPSGPRRAFAEVLARLETRARTAEAIRRGLLDAAARQVRRKDQGPDAPEPAPARPDRPNLLSGGAEATPEA